MTDIGHYADVLRGQLDMHPGISEKRMFGGQFFMLNGNMLCGIGKYGFMFRVGIENEPQALAQPGTSIAVTSRTMRGFIHVEPAVAVETGLDFWIDLARSYVGGLPMKTEGRT